MMNLEWQGDGWMKQVFESRGLRLVCDRQSGAWSFYADDVLVLVNVYAEFDLDGTSVSAADFAVHTAEREENLVRFIHSGHPQFCGSLIQVFELSDVLLTEVFVCGKSVSTNRVAPLVLAEGGLGEWGNGALVRIPFDNDMWVEPSITSLAELGGAVVSYEVTAVFDEKTNAGMVVGSVEHDVWKTGIRVRARDGKIVGCSVFGGAADDGTRDNSPHGIVSGTQVKSPKIFVGRFPDWRHGLTMYAKANTDVVLAKRSVADVPFGYNSWGVLQDKVSFSDMIAVSDCIREHLQNIWTEDGAAVYVNIDSFWDFIVHNDPAVFLSCNWSVDDALKAFVNHCHANGQKAGIYYTPFTAWHGDEDALKSSKMEGSDYTYYDAAMKKTDGSGLYGKLDSGYALDPTHPGTIARFEQKLRYFIDLGFEYVKLDFMTHGAVEGQHYDPDIVTGMQAYNAGMARIAAICEGKMFVNLSIAPLFPYQYADGRRISCDAFSSLDNTRHVLSYLTACFWEKELYPFPDPDHLVVWGKDGGVTDGEARCRVTSGILCGTSFLVGDDLSDMTDPAKQERIFGMFGNADIVSVAKLGRAFRPYAIKTGERCADAYWCTVDDTLYFAAFSFGTEDAAVSYDLADLLPAGQDYDIRELWRGESVSLDGAVLTYTIPAGDAAVFRIAATDMVIGTAEENRNFLPVFLGAAAVLLGAAMVYRKVKKQ